MGEGQDDAPKSVIGNRGRRMPPATLDLTATPVADDAAAPAGSVPVDAERAATVSVDSAEQPAPDAIAAPQSGETLTDAMDSHDPAENPSEVPSSAPARQGGARWLTATAVAAVLVALLVLTVTRPWDAPSVPPATEAASLSDRLARVESQITELSRRPAPTAEPAQSAALDGRIAAIESQLREVAARPAAVAGDPDRAAALAARLDDIAKRLDGAEQAGRRLDEITARMSRTETALAAPRPAAADPALDRRLGAIETAVKALGDRVADTGRRIDEVAVTARDADRHAETATAVAAAPSAADRAMRQAFLATALRSAAERGAPFAAELAALQPSVQDKARLAALEPFAATGLPSEAALSRELSAVLPALTVAATPPVTEGSLLDRIHLTTQHLVRIRRVGEVAGDDAAAVVARLDAKAAHGDVTGALAELAKLPPPVRAPAEGWIAKAKQRTAALDAAQALAADSLAALKSAP